MKELVKLEFRKLARSKSMYICLAIMLGFILLSAVAYKILIASAIDLGEVGAQFNNIDVISFTLTTLSNANFFIILGIIAAITFCFDFEEGTIKNIIARGYSRTSLFFAKVLNIICSTTFMFICSFAFSFGVGAIFFGVGNSNIASMLGLIGIQYLICLAYAMFFTFLSALIKKKAAAIAINIVAPLAVTVLLTVVDAIIKSETFSIANYWLDGMIINVSALGASTAFILTAIIGSLIYLAIFISLGVLVSRKTEV